MAAVKLVSLLAVLMLLAARTKGQGQADPANLPLTSFLPPALRSLQVSALNNKPIFNAQPWDPKATSCQPLLDAIASVRPGSALRSPNTGPDGPTFVTMTSPLYSLNSRNPGDPTRRVLVGASNANPGPGSSSPSDEPMSVLVHWHGTTSSPSEIQLTTYLASLRNTLVLTPASALGPLSFEWHLVQGDRMPDVWLMDDLVTCLSQSPRINTSRIYASGMSAGALHTTYLSLLRPHYLAAAVSFSGGISHLPLPAQNASVPPNTPADHAFAKLAPRLTPILATAGGPRDQVIIQFPVTTDRMQRTLWSVYEALQQTAPGTSKPLVVRCDHDKGHRIWMGPEAAAPFLMSSSRVWRVGSDEPKDPLSEGVLGTSEAGTCRWVNDAAAVGVKADEVKSAVEARAKEQGVGIGREAGKEVAVPGGRSGGQGSGASAATTTSMGAAVGVGALLALFLSVLVV
ncbi:hypothetical protein BCR44DRAFT_31627 [Catenaria anguillulae PL171]|uniref:Alpha/Beta hydrolase protein n=1 Tax=Catenaria anguillulae PL171 TaxID=765915 RepID=A0A1Y2HBD8_9FUNG|nr:hypothetical protein BCR44DRAFT_31627 [Catenaria anguillulae PL171]